MMGHPHFATRFKATLWLAATVLVALSVATVSTASAAEGNAAENGKSNNIVILKVPEGGTDRLFAEFGHFQAYALQDQKWFLTQIKDRAIDANGIMSSPEDLKWLMDAANIDWIVYLTPEDHSYRVRAVKDETGKPSFETFVDRTGQGLSKPSAKLIRIEFGKATGLTKPTPAPAPSEPAKPESEANPTNIRKQAEEENEKIAELAKSNWAWVAARFRLFKRDLNIAGQNESVLSYNSTFYPGFEIDGEIYPLSPIDPESASAGVYLDFIQGFESVSVLDENDKPRTVAISQTEFEVGPIFRLGDIFDDGALDRTRVRVKATVRYSVFAVDPNPQLPTNSLTAIIFGGDLSQPILFDGLSAEGRLEISPIGFFGKGGDLFGESAFSHSFTSRIGLLYAFTDELRALAGYRFRLNHTRFNGEGTADFLNSESFELVQGIDVGIQYEY